MNVFVVSTFFDSEASVVGVYTNQARAKEITLDVLRVEEEDEKDLTWVVEGNAETIEPQDGCFGTVTCVTLED